MFDPHNDIHGEVREIWLDAGKVVAGPAAGQPVTTIDAAGCAVLPGGVEIHSHVAGAKVNSGRIMCPEDHAHHFRQHTEITRAGWCGQDRVFVSAFRDF